MLAAGDLDQAFGVNGLAQTLTATEDFARQGVLQHVDGEDKTVILADTSAGQRLIRYNSDGSLDSTFGGDQGVNLNQLPSPLKNIAAQGDRFLVLTKAPSPLNGGDMNSVIVRYLSDGSLDDSFGNHGILTTDIVSPIGQVVGGGSFFFQPFAARIVAQGDKTLIAVTGVADTTQPGEYDVIVARYTSTGDIDHSFGNDGQIVINGLAVDVVSGLQVDGDAVVLAVDSYDGFSTFSNLIRIAGNGLDMQFAASGFLSIPFNNQALEQVDDRSDWAMQGGKTLLATTVFQENAPDDFDDDANVFALKRYDSSGNLDPSFGADGVALLDGFGPGPMAFDPYGGVILIQGLSAVRIKPNGQLDTSFGTNGIAPFFNGATDQFAGFTVQSDGKIVVFGTRSGETADIILSRLLGSEDGDGDGMANVIDTLPATFSDDFSDSTTTGTITSRGDQLLTIVDAPNHADGVLISTDVAGGATPAAVHIDGGATNLSGAADLSFSAGTQVIATHGSVILNVVAGTVDATFTADTGEVVATADLAAGTELTFKPDTVTFIAPATSDLAVEVQFVGASGQEGTASISAGNEITFNPDSFAFTAPATNTEPVEVVVNGDSLSIAPGTSKQPVQIDIRPGVAVNTVNLDSNGVIAVAILSTADFDARRVAAGSVRFAGASMSSSAFQDVNGDGRLDLVLNFRTQQTTLRSLYQQLLADDINGDGVLDSSHQVASVSLSGETLDHVLVEGFDSLDLFLAGKSLRTLLDQLAASGAI